MAGLTTHVLDTARGRPADGLHIELYRLDDERTLVTSAVTNNDGRCDQPLMSGEQVEAGLFELVFHCADYLILHHGQRAGSFLDQVPVRFRIDSPSEHYHVPLLLSPYGYSTYRGS